MHTAGNSSERDHTLPEQGLHRLRQLVCFAVVGLAAFCLTAARDPESPRPDTPQHPLATNGGTTRRATDFGRLPLTFEANRGQADGRVKFLSRGAGYTLFLAGDVARLVLRKPPADGNPKLEIGNSEFRSRRFPLVTRQGDSVVHMRLVGANPRARMVGLDMLPVASNYFLGKDPARWRTNVPNYGKVKSEQVYPGIDLLYYGNQRQLEYDFVVAPGADPRAIRFAVETGSSRVENGQSQIPTPTSKIVIDANGDLVIAAEGAEVRFHKPVVFQEPSKVESQQSKAADNPKSQMPNRRYLDGRYVLRAEDPKSRNPDPEFEVSFQLASYDPALPLVIDPVLSYSTYLGGSGFDYAAGVAVDGASSAYVTGYTNSLDFPLQGGAQAAPGGGTCGNGLDTYTCFDAFIVKLDPTGTRLVYATYFGGSGEDYGAAIAVDASGAAYIAGYTNSADLPTANAAQATRRGGMCGSTPCFDAFAAKLDSSGASLVYSTYLGGTADDYGQGIAVDATGGAVVNGFTAARDFPLRNALQSRFGGGSYDAFVARLDPQGNALAYSTYLGGSGDDFGARIAVDAAGNAYATGYTNSPDFPTLHALQPAYAAGTCGAPPSTFPCFDAYVSKLGPQGSFAYSTYLGGSGGDYGYGIAVDASGSAYLTGQTTSVDFPVTWRALQTSGGGTSTDAFVTKLSPDGAAVAYSTYLGGLGAEAGLDVAVDAAGSAYVAGYTYGNGFPLARPVQGASGGYFDAFLAKLDAAGAAMEFSTYLGGSGNERGRGVAVDANRNVYLVGETFSENFPRTSATLQPWYNGGSYDGFIAKLSAQPVAALRLSRDVIVFEGMVVGTSSAPEEVTLANSGDLPLALSGITTTGDFTQTNDCDDNLPTGAGCTIRVTFIPAAAGPRTGSLTVTNRLPQEVQSASLFGMGRDFSVSASPGAAEIAAGKTATFTLTLVPAGGFNQAVTLGCSGAPPAASCAVSPSSVMLDGTSSAQATVTVQTTGRTTATLERGLPPRRPFPTAFPATLAVLLAAWSARRPGRRLRLARASVVALVFVALLWPACGGGGGGGGAQPAPPPPAGTPAGTYTLTLTGTYASLTRSVTVKVTVK
jgi:hypothetical protein